MKGYYMKILIASDIHGSAEYSEKLLGAYNSIKPDKLLLLGDLLYHGPRNALPYDYDTKRTLKILNSLKENIIAVRGNCDAEVDQMVLDFPIMNDYEQIEADGVKLFATHGHHFNPQTPPPFVDMDVLLNGHTHIPMIKQYDGFVCVNPGSVSIPKAGSDHSFAVFDGGVITLNRLGDLGEYDRIDLRN
ncbi:MAG: phosphodiesterase [Anaerovoracaceae bacterium]|jgi:putative phosphoesterase